MCPDSPCLAIWPTLVRVAGRRPVCCPRWPPCGNRASLVVRHRISAVLALAVWAELTGCRSLTAIGEWAADASDQALSVLGDRGSGAV